MKSNVTFCGFNCRIRFDRYAADGAPALQLVDASDGQPVATCTVWIDNLRPGEVAIKTYSGHEGMDLLLIEAGIIHPETVRTHASGWVQIPVYRLTNEALLKTHAVPA